LAGNFAGIIERRRDWGLTFFSMAPVWGGRGGDFRAGLDPSRAVPAVSIVLVWALAAVAVGGAFRFLLGHPRRLVEETVARESGPGSPWLIRTGQDDIVDW
jgi:hypothetical protein